MMRKSLLAVVAATVALLGGCSLFQSSPPPNAPEVSVGADGRISVRPEPLDFSKDQKEVVITWRLPKDSPFTFADNGIVIEDSKEPVVRARGEFVDCKAGAGGKTFSCRNLHKGKGRHKYTIYLRDGGKELPPHDPLIFN